MTSQKFMENRRKFLAQSALGFGSALFLPSLLASCTDHGPGTDPVDPSPGADTDWNELAKTAITTGLASQPEVGTFLSALTGVFWPGSGNDVWSLIKDQVEAQFDPNTVINQDNHYIYDNVQLILGSMTPTPTGLASYIATYQSALKNGTPSDINGAWMRAVKAFAEAQVNFQDERLQVPLLPFFAQFANLYLALLRDGAYYGPRWGRSALERLEDANLLRTAIVKFSAYAATIYKNGYDGIVSHTKEDKLKVEPFRSYNAYDRTMTMLVLDYMDTWQYYDISIHKSGAKKPDGTPIPLFTREIYSDPYGNIKNDIHPDAPGIVLLSPATQFPSQITVWGGERIDAVQLTYPVGGGPGGVTTTARMGDTNGGASQVGIVDIPSGFAITSASVSYDVEPGGYSTDPQLINTLQFKLSGGNTISETNQFGGAMGRNKSGEIEYPNYALSSIYIHGTNFLKPDSSADCIVFGFMRRR